MFALNQTMEINVKCVFELEILLLYIWVTPAVSLHVNLIMNTSTDQSNESIVQTKSLTVKPFPTQKPCT
jgi:hypothetical protein